ncbi:hypothetical protein EPB69_10215 [Geobacillus stearothermophilus]|nr:hypothetical protein EPB69_10215 [Geobacillus stearothermophilus]
MIKKSPLGMMQGCQPHHSPYQGGLQMNCTQNYKIDQVTEQTLVRQECIGSNASLVNHTPCYMYCF